MTFRSRLLLGAIMATVLPLAGVAFFVRREVRDVMRQNEAGRVADGVRRLQADLDQAASDLGRRLDGFARQLPLENAVRLALDGRMPRAILTNYGPGVIAGTGLDALWLLTSEGLVLTSGHHPDEADSVMAGWAAQPPDAVVIAGIARPTDTIRVLALTRPVALEGWDLVLVGGRALPRLLAGVDTTLRVAFRAPTDPPAPGDGAASLPVDVRTVNGQWGRGALVLTHDPAPLRAALSRLDRLFLTIALAAVLLALAASAGLARRLSAPIERLVERTDHLDLQRLEFATSPARDDEVGRLERTLAALVTRLRVSVAGLRDAERRAAVGDVARQVNHDIKNGLVPIRNVMRHLAETAERSPEQLATVFRERHATLESSVSYLEQLAVNYARLTPPVTAGSGDLAAIVRSAAEAVGERDGLRVAIDVPPHVTVSGDPVALRRVAENILSNAADAAAGELLVRLDIEGALVRFRVKDDGPGMTPTDLERALAGFHSTKPDGTGLGLTVVRRLVQDLSGSLRIDTAPGEGTEVTVELPAA